MLKLIGALFILFAGTMIGFTQSFHLTRRPRQVRGLILALQRLETEVLYGFTPLAEALRIAARPLEAALADILNRAADAMSRTSEGKSAADSWREAVESGWKGTSMKTGEREVLLQLGYSLGISDREDQVKHIRLAVSTLLAEEQAAAEECKRYANACKSLGILGAALVIVVIF